MHINIYRNFIIIWKRLGKNFTVPWQYYDTSANFFLKGNLINLLGFRPYGLCSKYSVVLLYHKSSYRQYRKNCCGCVPTKLFFYKNRWLSYELQSNNFCYGIIIGHMTITTVTWRLSVIEDKWEKAE